MVLLPAHSAALKRTLRPALYWPWAALLIAAAGCASPEVPRPPSLKVPDRVASLVAERRGGTVILSFITPVRTTDGATLTSAVTASLCRAVGNEPCRATESFPAPQAVTGAVEWTDVLPPPLAAGPPRRLTYTVQITNSAGRSDGASEPAVTLAGAAPVPVTGLRADGERDGIALRWTPETAGPGEVLLRREVVGQANTAVPAKPPAAAANGRPARKGIARAKPVNLAAGNARSEPGVTLLRAADSTGQNTAGAGDRGGMVDGTAVAGTPYRYVALRSVTVSLGGVPLEMRSVPSAPVEFTLRDIYPPAIPTGLMAAQFPLEHTGDIAVDLVWQPNTEADLAGYNVYRQVLRGNSAGASEKLNPQVLPLPAFHDAGLRDAGLRDAGLSSGVTVRYAVVAVDKSGNASAASAPADVHLSAAN